MAVKIRMKRIGRRNRPFYRICVFDSRTRRDGAPVEELGAYNPYAETLMEKVSLNAERALYWLGVGAQPSETVASIFRRLGVRKGGEVPEALTAAAVAAAAASEAPAETPVPVPTEAPAKSPSETPSETPAASTPEAAAEGEATPEGGTSV